MISLYNRVIKVYKQKGLSGLIKAIITYPFRFLYFIWQYIDLYMLYYLLRGKNIFTLENLKIQFPIISSADARAFCYTYKWEKHIWKYILRELKPNDVFWDIGASIGFYSLLAASYPDVKVIAFEPNPYALKTLRKNIELNKKSNIKVLNTALSDSEGTAGFDTIERDHKSPMAHLTKNITDCTVEVAVNRGDNLIKSGDIPAPDILKIDVEGAEHLVIKGMGNTLSSCRLVVCEIHSTISRYGSSKDDFETYLRNEGFNIEYEKNIPEFSAYHVLARHSK